jgi:O-antigen/teichoic acid export membrane protein
LKLVGSGLFLRIIGLSATFLVNILLARELGPTGFGQLSLALSWLLLLSGLLKVGMSNFLTRETAEAIAQGRQSQTNHLTKTALLVMLAASTLTAVATIVVSALFFEGTAITETRDLLLVGSPMIVILCLAAVLDATTRGMGLVVRSQLGEFTARPVTILLGVLALAWTTYSAALTPRSAMIMFVTGSCAALLVSFAVRPRLEVPRSAAEYSRPPLLFWLLNAVPLSVLGVLSLLTLHTTPILMGFYSDSDQVARLQVASQFAFVPSLLVVITNASLANKFSQCYVKGELATIKKLAVLSCNMSLAFAIVFFAICAIFGEALVVILLGAEYGGLQTTLMITTAGALANAATGASGAIITAFRLEKHTAIGVGISVIVNALAGTLLIPSFEATGGAIAILLCLTSWNAYFVFVIRKKLGFWCLPGIKP